MARYTFRFETLRHLRQARRDQLRSSLAEAVHAVDLLREEQARLAGEFAGMVESRRRALAGGAMDLALVLEAQRYEVALKAREATLARNAEMLNQEVERRRALVIDAEREVKTLDKLDERRREEHRAEAERLDARALDEAASVGHAFRLRAGDGIVNQ